MESRRVFVGSAAAALGAPSLSAASKEIVVGAIGCGGRMNRHLLPHLLISENVRVAAICDVYRPNLETAAGLAGQRVDQYGDYRRIIERKDIDAVVIATPDHWHGPMTIAACESGKDVYVEKPLSNNIQDCLKAVEAARKHRRVVQVALQQRSSLPFHEAYKVCQSGILGNIRHVVLINPSGGSRRPATGAPARSGTAAVPSEPPAPPADLDWEMFQGPAPRRPYSPMRQQNWRSYWEYGAGTLSDWGVHLLDVAHWYLGVTAPPATAAAAWGWFSRPQDERTPDTVDVTWRYDKFVLSYSTRGGDEIGTYFYGDQGMLHVNRYGYSVKPAGGSRGPGGKPPFEAKTIALRDEDQISKPSLESDCGKHITNWLNCIRTRQRPTVDIEIGATSTIPTLMGAMSILSQGKAIAWQGGGAKPLT